MSRTQMKAKGRASRETSIGSEIPIRYQHSIAAAVIFGSLLMFFSSVVFKGETFLPPDTIAAHSWDTLLKQAEAEGEFPLWNPYIFCGMPGFGSLTFHGERLYDLTGTLWSIFRNVLSYAFLNADLGRWILYYVILGFGVYLFVYHRVSHWIIALIAGMGVVYASYTIILVPSGHMTKIAVIAWLPYALLLVEGIKERLTLLRVMLLSFVLALLIQPGHVQFIFYVYLIFGFYVLHGLIRVVLRREPWKPVVRVATVLALTTMIALSLGADQYLSVLEYNPSSIRGAGPIDMTSESEVERASGKLDYDYATSWSLPPGELMTFVVPTWSGFGSYTYRGPLTQGFAQRINTYFGPQVFTEAPYYSGVVILMLAGVGFWSYRKDSFVVFATGAIIFSVLLSFGKEFPILYDPMYAYFPFFGKFRIPSMIMVLVQFFLPILAAYGLKAILVDRLAVGTDELRRRWTIAAAGAGVLTILMTIVRDIPASLYGIFTPASDIVAAFSAKGYHPQVAAGLQSIVTERVASEVVLAAGVVCVGCLIVVLFIRSSISLRTAGLLFLVLVTADLWRVVMKPVESRKETVQQAFQAPTFLPALKADSTLYRVLRLRDGIPPFDNSLAYWGLSSAYGYHGAKIRRYQDIVENAGITNPTVWQLLNVKYIISNQPDSSDYLTMIHQSQEGFVYRFEGHLPRAFFVDRSIVADDRTVMRAFMDGTFDPRLEVFLEAPLEMTIEPPGEAASISNLRQGINTFSATVTATGNNLAVFSEAYYPHGWRAYIGETEVPIHRVNYFFRGIVVPPGRHELRMVYDPASYTTGRNISLGANLIILIALVIGGRQYAGILRKKPDPDAPVSTTD